MSMGNADVSTFHYNLFTGGISRLQSLSLKVSWSNYVKPPYVLITYAMYTVLKELFNYTLI